MPDLTATPPGPRPRDGDSFDLIVVGAGANGLGIARDAAARGLRVCVLEKEDLCSGTSSWNGRLIHGGLRYLEQLDVRLVRESLRERECLFRLAPHLVKPIHVLMPFVTGNRRPAWLIRLGMVAYDVLSWDKSQPRHRILTRAQTLARVPGVAADKVSGAALFVDGQVEFPERLCVELALAARADGVAIRTHARVDEAIVEGRAIAGVRFRDQLTSERGEVRAPLVINAAGPWVDRVFGPPFAAPRLIGGTKGSHLVVERFSGAPSDVVYHESHSDHRLILVIPWHGRLLIGTTDQRYEDDPDHATADPSEIAYLLDETNRLFPGAGLTLASVVYSFSGVRPLPYAPGRSEGALPRSHVIHDHAPQVNGLLSVVGGKLTTYRSLAQDAVDLAFRKLGRRSPACPTERLAFPGAPTKDPAALRAGLAAGGLPASVAHRLVDIYGGRAPLVIDGGRASAELVAPLDDTGLTGAELLFAVDEEMARTLTDALLRRTLVGLEPGHGLDIAARAAQVIGPRLGWDADRQREEVDAYSRYVERFALPGHTTRRPVPT
jgi:glycerol-3-phosphate dehydrogenase